MPGLSKLYRYLIVYVVAIALVALVLITPVFITGAAFSIYNPSWNGCSQFAVKTYNRGVFQPTLSLNNSNTGVQVNELSFLDYDLTPTDSAIFIIGPDLNFTADDAKYLKNFLVGGGKVLLADDFGTGNDVLKQINSNVRFSRSLLVDLAFEKEPDFPVAFNITAHELTHNVSKILLNYPTALLINPKNNSNVNVLITSSNCSWIDVDNSSTLKSSEKMGPLPILATEKFGLGELILLSDPSIMINSMQKYFDNAVLTNNLLNYLSAGRSIVLIDESHRSNMGVLDILFVSTPGIPIALKSTVIIAIIALFFILATDIPNNVLITVRKSVLPYLLRSRYIDKNDRKVMNMDKIIEDLIKSHPEWDRKTLIMLAKRFEPNKKT